MRAVRVTVRAAQNRDTLRGEVCNSREYPNGLLLMNLQGQLEELVAAMHGDHFYVTGVDIEPLDALAQKSRSEARGAADESKGVAALGLRPCVVVRGVDEPTLACSVEDAINILGEGEGGLLLDAFMYHGTRGIWLLPHPERRSQ